MEEWRTLLYPLGFLSAIAFGGRFIIQWLASERAQKTVVPRSFWLLSLAGNLLLALHSLIQVQYHICLVQSCNAVISWRNLNLMRNKEAQVSFSTTLWLLAWTVMATALLFWGQDLLLGARTHWFRTPITPWQTQPTDNISFYWHFLGTMAYLLFSSRFWLQWIISERTQQSELPPSFWWLSLGGAFFSIVYFLHLGDWVNLIGPLVGLIPYIRNLMLQLRTRPSPRKT